MNLPVLRPDWAAPLGVRALMTTREGGVSLGPFGSLNVSGSVGDDEGHVTENRRRVQAALGAPVFTPHLVHASAVVRIDRHSMRGERPRADACWTRDADVACGVTAADCLPVLFSSEDGCVVAAAHAGWRGLAAGVLRATVRALENDAGCRVDGLHAWLGACIGPMHFEVGADVLRAFGAPMDGPSPNFRPRPRADGSAAWLANLPQLAREQLRAAGVRHISGGEHCTVADASRFFSYRRDRVTGRMLAAVVCTPR